MVRKTVYIMLIMITFMMFSGFSIDRIPRWFKAHLDYLNEKYESSIKGFSEAMSGEDDSVMLYNKGTAEYKAELFHDAEESFSQAVEVDPEFAEAWYNQGNARFRKGDLEGAIESYEKTLEINPDDEDARYNLEFVKNLLEQSIGSQKSDSKDEHGYQPPEPSPDGDQEPSDDEYDDESEQEREGKEDDITDSDEPGVGENGMPEEDDMDEPADGDNGLDDSDSDQPSEMDSRSNVSGLTESQIQDLLDALEMQERALAGQMARRHYGKDDERSDPLGLFEELWSIRDDLDPFARMRKDQPDRDEVDW